VSVAGANWILSEKVAASTDEPKDLGAVFGDRMGARFSVRISAAE